MDTERAILEEFGRCMTQIISSTQSGMYICTCIKVMHIRLIKVVHDILLSIT